MNHAQKIALMEHLFDKKIDLYQFWFDAYSEEMWGTDIAVLHLKFRDDGGNYHHIGITLSGKQRTYVEEHAS